MSGWGPIPLPATTGEARSNAFSLARLQNMYVQTAQSQSKTRRMWFGFPGLKEWTTVGSGTIRGMRLLGNKVYVVVGNTLYAVDRTSKSQKTIGVIAGHGDVAMEHNGTHMAICTAGGPAYAANEADGVLTLPESNLRAVAYQDGYLIYVQQFGEKFWLSGLDDATDIPATDFSTADRLPDNVVSVQSDHGELWIFGDETISVWENQGFASFPFVRVQFIEHGCASPLCTAKAENAVLWLSDKGRVYMARGYQPQRISTTAIEQLIAADGNPEVAKAFTYSQLGHTWYVLLLNSITLQYDLGTGSWSVRKSYGIDRWRGSHHEQIDETTHLIADYSTNQIFELDPETYDEDGDPLIRSLTTPPISGGPDHIMYDELWLDCQAGAGLTSGQGSDPKVMLDWTDDAGHTWSNELTATLGKRGKYQDQAFFTRLGRSRNRSFRFACSDPVPFRVMDAKARMSGAAA